MRFGPFWWLAPIAYGFHRSQSTQRPSRPPQTRIIVRSRATCGRSARALSHGKTAPRPASMPALIRSRRPRSEDGGRSVISGVPHGRAGRGSLPGIGEQRIAAVKPPRVPVLPCGTPENPHAEAGVSEREGAAMPRKLALYASVGPELTQYDIDVDGAALTRRGAVGLPAN